MDCNIHLFLFQTSFGVSNFLGTIQTAAKSDNEADCKTDFLVVSIYPFQVQDCKKKLMSVL